MMMKFNNFLITISHCLRRKTSEKATQFTKHRVGRRRKKIAKSDTLHSRFLSDTSRTVFGSLTPLRN